LLIETALAYAGKIAGAETLEQAQEFARVVVEQLGEVKARVIRRRT
jgi:hypothetical protein